MKAKSSDAPFIILAPLSVPQYLSMGELLLIHYSPYPAVVPVLCSSMTDLEMGHEESLRFLRVMAASPMRRPK